MKNNVKSLLALMVIVFAATSCGKTEKPADGVDSTTVAVDTIKVDTTHAVEIDTTKIDTVTVK